MFNLKDDDKSSFQEANDFYSYAKGLAILQENLDRATSINSRISGDLIRKVREEIVEAMRTLVKQVQK